jgi:poly-D-alanine transfer protein DltD
MVFQKKQPGVTEPLENPYNLMKSRKESPSYRNFQLLINILNGVHVQAGWIIIP